jgi:hypothetical protein
MDPEQDFDFDRWRELAINDPQAFEAERVRVIEQAIAEAPARSRERLLKLQWKLDQIRRTSRTPLAAALRMHQLLSQSVWGERGLLEHLRWLQTGIPPQQAGPRAPVLPFRR